MMTERRVESFGDGERGQILASLYRDGDLVVCHGERGYCESMVGVSGYDRVMEMCDSLDIGSEVEDEIIQFVSENTDYFGV